MTCHRLVHAWNGLEDFLQEAPYCNLIREWSYYASQWANYSYCKALNSILILFHAGLLWQVVYKLSLTGLADSVFYCIIVKLAAGVSKRFNPLFHRVVYTYWHPHSQSSYWRIRHSYSSILLLTSTERSLLTLLTLDLHTSSPIWVTWSIHIRYVLVAIYQFVCGLLNSESDSIL